MIEASSIVGSSFFACCPKCEVPWDSVWMCENNCGIEVCSLPKGMPVEIAKQIGKYKVYWHVCGDLELRICENNNQAATTLLFDRLLPFDATEEYIDKIVLLL